MYRKSALFAFLLFLAACLPVVPARAQNLNSVLEKLDAAARDFHTATAKFEFHTIQTVPVYDDDGLGGTAYYERNGSHFQMAAHITTHIVDHVSHPTERAYIFSGGSLRISDTGKEKDAKPYDQAGKYESYLMLGFGASGEDLKDKWTITYEGEETIDGIATDKLKLVAKDPQVLKLFPSVTIWLDTARAVSLKQVFDEGEGTSRICTYTDIKLNKSLPKDAFKFAK